MFLAKSVDQFRERFSIMVAAVLEFGLERDFLVHPWQRGIELKGGNRRKGGGKLLVIGRRGCASFYRKERRTSAEGNCPGKNGFFRSSDINRAGGHAALVIAGHGLDQGL